MRRRTWEDARDWLELLQMLPGIALVWIGLAAALVAAFFGSWTS